VALTRAVWTRADLHVVRGAPSRRLDSELRLFDDATPAADIFGNNPPAHLRVRFEPGFAPEGQQDPGRASGHGVSVDTGTGVVTVLPAPAGGRRLRNFLLTAVAKDTNTNLEVRNVIRVHAHDALADAWLTPVSLTVRPASNEFEHWSFSFLARFDDGVIGDIGNWELQWSTDPPSAVLPATSDVQVVDAAAGDLIARRAGARARVIVTYPPLALTRDAQVICVEEWNTPRELTWVAGKDPAKWREVPNILFLPDGFVDGEDALFETLVRNIARKLRTTSVLRPFDCLHDAINCWAAFVPSDEAGFSWCQEVYTVADAGGLAARPLPGVRAPQADAARWSLEELLHQVGLPVASDAGRPLTGAPASRPLLPDWQAVYGPHVTEDRVGSAWKDWRTLATRTLLNERNTALGIVLGTRPRVQDPSDTLHMSFERVRPSTLDGLFAGLTYRGQPVGGTWRRDAGATPRGKDLGLVCILTRTRRGRASFLGDVYLSPLAKRPAHMVRAAAARGVDILPVRLKHRKDPMPPGEEKLPAVDVDDPPFDTVATVAHETGHALLLGDEYPEGSQKDLAPGTDLSDDANLQDAQSVLVQGTGRLDSSRIKWAGWHRIVGAGVLAQDPDPPDVAPGYRLTLLPGHALQFKKDDLIRLRLRPLVPVTRVSHVMRVKETPAAGQAHLDVTVAFDGWTSPGHFRAGSVVMKMLRWPFSGLGTNNLGEELTLMARNIREHIDASQLPLNARRGRSLAACDFDHDGQQQARNLPDGLPKCRPRNRSRIVGLFEGGSQVHCGVYHPTGACVMRTAQLGNGDLIPFCPVCRYVMVDLLDPTKHGIIDADYAKIYPDPRT
jgi:hypothetical protein